MARLPAVTVLVRWGSSVLQHRRLDPPREVLVQEDSWKQLDPAYLALPLDLLGLHEPAPLLQVENGQLLLVRWPHASVSVESPDSARPGGEQRSPYRASEEAPRVRLSAGDVARVVAGPVTFEIHVDGEGTGPREPRLPPRWLGVLALSAAVHAGALQAAMAAAHRQSQGDLEEASREGDLLRLSLLQAAIERDDEQDAQIEAEEARGASQSGEGTRGDEGRLMTLEEHLRWLRKGRWRAYPIRYGTPLSGYRISEELAYLDDEYLHPDLPPGMGSPWYPAPWQPSLQENPLPFTEYKFFDPWLLLYLPGVGENDRRAAWFSKQWAPSDDRPVNAAGECQGKPCLKPGERLAHGNAQISLLQFQVHGAIDENLARAALRRSFSRIRHCVENNTPPRSLLKNHQYIAFTVDKRGAPVNIRVGGYSERSSPRLSRSKDTEGCVMTAVEGITSLPGAKGSAVVVSTLAVERQ